MGLFNKKPKKKAIIIDEQIIEIDDLKISQQEVNYDEKSFSDENIGKSEKGNFLNLNKEIEFEKLFALKTLPYLLSALSIVFSLISLFITLCGGKTGSIVFLCLAITSTLAAIVCTAIKEFKSRKMVIDYRYLFILVSIVIILI